MIRDKAKILLGIKDDLQDDVLDLIISNVTAHLMSLLKKPEVPPALDFVILEVVVRRFHRLGSEGMKTESVEGHSVAFYDLKDEFVPFLDIIAEYRDDEDVNRARRGKVCMI
ncbi:phage head-tail connector protein [Shouchella lonarensis]|uniref:Phage gp6-like head-tail connector protein n=1 Tax=Shouchella lonarensis TaxID=1464122 RepID=A0A1G6HQ85_9BACI|nr:phage head-tail connector protein [Shouchella lonarensis]SDB96457.1 Phage gp6-like head-tail connector protein [Shouchella lonarensis]